MFHKPNIPALFAQVAESETRHVMRFREHLKVHHSREIKALYEQPEELDAEYADLLADDRYFLDEVLSLADQLAIIALYRIVEFNVKSLMGHVLPGVSSRKYSSIMGLHEVLNNSFNIDLNQVPFYHSMNELRLINNAIKHEGVVDAELAAYPAWTQGGDLVGLDTAFERLAPDVPKYIEALASKVA
ncbi:MAG: hypothetical protein ABI163_15500 [Thermoanaerobaculia bacterium]